MAHSSGGGSSGGGCHGGSSGSSSHGRSHRIPTYHSHPVPGTQRYSYRNRAGQKRYFYSNMPPARYQLTNLIMPILFLVGALFVFFSQDIGYFSPEKLDSPGGQILIDDRLGILEEQETLRQKLTRFYEETGVIPAVQTVAREDWNGEYFSLEDYALSEYYRLFPDEVHWLIVYSVPVDAQGAPRLSVWSFEGIIGDDTGPSIHDRHCDWFTRDVYENLSVMQPPEQAIGDAFYDLLAVRKPTFYAEELLGGSALLNILAEFIVILLWPLRELWICYLSMVKYRNAVWDQ